VWQSALNAAFRDPRFFPVSLEEWKNLQLEISVMGPIERVASFEEIMVGRDGLIISSGSCAGLLLPQVASEHGWDRETFLSQTCLKAGLTPAAWRSSDTKIERFSAEVFGDETTDSE
jgi:AmmeMemoRadiSam system protein A